MTKLLMTLALAASSPAPQLLGLHVSDGSRPFAGDRTLLTTVSPNGDGFRDRAIVSFRLARPATVKLDVVATQMVRAGKTGTTIVWSTTRTFAPGPGSLVWRPVPTTEPRTYILRLTVRGE